MTTHSKQLTHDDYKRAESHMPWFLLGMGKVKNAQVQANWCASGDSFWYVSQNHHGYSFVQVESQSGIKSEAFNHVELAQALTSLLGKEFDAHTLPFASFSYVNNININENQAIRFSVAEHNIEFDFDSKTCRFFEASAPVIKQGETLSPDSKQAAFVKDFNLWLRDVENDVEKQLTHDGVEHFAYGLQPEGNLTSINAKLDGIVHAAVALWSADSTKLIVHQLDERKVRDFNLLQNSPKDGSAWPIHHSAKVSAPGDKNVALVDHFIIETSSGKTTKINHNRQLALFGSPLQEELIFWSEDASSIYFIEQVRGDTALSFYQVDSGTGDVRKVLSETGDCMIYSTPNPGNTPLVKVLDETQEVIWYSERDNRGHFYLYDLQTGELKNQITQGEWQVRELLHLDITKREILFSAGEREADRDPYYRHLYRINLDGSDLRLLSQEDADHEVQLPKSAFAVSISADLAGGSSSCGISPCGRYIVETYSRINLAPVSLLRNREGELLSELEAADTTLLEAEGWQWPQPFKTLADDGETDIHGAIWYPRDFDPSKKYPVIDMVYGGPQALRTPKKSFNTEPADLGYLLAPQSYTELGFICVSIDGRGTPYRSKSIHDFSYNNLQGCAGLVDHITAIKQLADKHDYIDLDRVGINGHSGGGYTTVRGMLEYPDFYKVGVSSAAANDYRGYCGAWTERYQGYPVNGSYEAQDNRTLAANLKGKLLMAYGDMDDNVNGAMTIQLVEALTLANKDYDLIVLANKDHTCVGNPYLIRRSWDYFVKHLLDGTPPEGYQVWDGLAALLGK